MNCIVHEVAESDTTEQLSLSSLTLWTKPVLEQTSEFTLTVSV